MSLTLATQRGSDPAVSTAPMLKVDATVHLSTRTLGWLADHPSARRLVRSVWDKLTELERAGQHPGPIDGLRRVLARYVLVRLVWPAPEGTLLVLPYLVVGWLAVRSVLLPHGQQDRPDAGPRDHPAAEFVTGPPAGFTPCHTRVPF